MSHSNSTDTGFSENKARLSGWLEAENYRIRPGTAPEAAWLVLAEDPQGRKVLVGQPNEKPEQIVFQSSITIVDDQAMKLEDLNRDQRRTLLKELSLFLIGLGLHYDGIKFPLKTIRLEDRRFMPDLSRTEFVETVKRLRNGTIAVTVLLADAVGQLPPQEMGSVPPIN